jgi:hypothetical protein
MMVGFRPRRAVSVLALIALAVIVVGASGANGATGSRASRAAAPIFSLGVQLQSVFDASGNPVVVANFVPDGSLATATWAICPPQTPTECRSVRSQHGVVQPGAEPAGTRFVATAVYESVSYTASAVWHGRVHALSRPSLRGPRRLNGIENRILARWAGGWGSETDQLGVEACRTASGRDCRMLGGGELYCPDATSRTRLGGWFTGWYLFALDARLPADDVCAGTGYFANADLPLWKPGATITRSLALGAIAGPPRPQLKIFRHVILRGDTLIVGSIDCLTRCTVSLTIMDATVGRSARLTAIGSKEIGVRRGQLAHGKLQIEIRIDDSQDIEKRSLFTVGP